jgi:hypothetical protein
MSGQAQRKDMDNHWEDKLERLEHLADKNYSVRDAIRIVRQASDLSDEQVRADLAGSLRCSASEIQNFQADKDGGTFNCKGQDYRFFWDIFKAERVAVAHVQKMLETSPESFDQAWVISIQSSLINAQEAAQELVVADGWDTYLTDGRFAETREGIVYFRG